MTLEIFGQEMKDRIQKKMGNGYEIDLDWFWENNGRKNGKVTIRRAGTNICPAARLDRHFEMLEESVSEMDLEKAAEEIIRECSRPIPMKESVTEMGLRITDYEFCKDRLLFKLVNTDWNQELLKENSHVPFLDLSVLFYLMVGEEEGMSATLLVSENLRKIWGVTAEELYLQALQNTPEKMPPVFVEMNAWTFTRMMLEPESLPEMPEATKMERNTLYCLTNRSGKYGAAAIQYPGVLKECAEKCGMDMVVFPSSVHEILLMPLGEGDSLDDFTEWVREINQSKLEEDEVLSDHVYRYDYKTGRLLAA